ncbi:formimidoylglutamate deiminase [Streptomyces avicenniae]|uniref:formimidoylglutamate deiminase n=1 Tax=Streptomyces avicenniae TaxID=500153 RepID=UPI000AE41FB9|nr:formimidoylglutamate deiminase [Streptomyces avicenniae]
MSLTAQLYWAEHAWLGGTVEPGVALATAPSGRITEVHPGLAAPPIGAVPLRGLTVPGFANAHSHAFHRALRGLSQVGGGTFWTWRDGMYDTAARLTPASYGALARAVFAEMALAGITSVGEFHYVHHRPDGTPYGEPNAMGLALAAAAEDAGLRLTLLDTCYLAAGFGRPPGPRQLRFSDGTADAWAARAAALPGGGTFLVGAAVHSVRAVPAGELATVARWAADRDAPLHLHLSEQPAENDDCLRAHGVTPTRLAADHGLLGPRTTAVHATHLTDDDIRLLADSGTAVCLCPTTERDLADGIGPAAGLRDAGAPLCLGTDSHTVIDPLAETRALEGGERLRSGRRGHFTPAELLGAAGAAGHAALGRPEGGRLAAGALADFTTLALDSVRTTGCPPALAAEAVLAAGTAADVRHTVVAGRHIVRDGIHQLLPDVPGLLDRAITSLHHTA